MMMVGKSFRQHRTTGSTLEGTGVKSSRTQTSGQSPVREIAV